VSSRNRVLIYDYEEGCVVDAETGEVVERIYDYSPPSRDVEKCGEKSGSPRRAQVVSRKYYRNRGLYAKARRLERKGFVVDYSRLFSVGFKWSLKRPSSIKLEQFFRELGLLPELEEIIGEIGREAPHLLTRSRRAQLLVAYVLRELRAGRTPSYSEFKDIVSDGLFRKAVRIASRLLYKAPSSGRGVHLAEAGTG